MVQFFSLVEEIGGQGIPTYTDDSEAKLGEVYIISNLPPTVIIGAATNISGTGFTANGAVNNTDGPNVSKLEISFGTSSLTDPMQGTITQCEVNIANGGSISETITYTLVAGEYKYWIRAFDGAWSQWSGAQIFSYVESIYLNDFVDPTWDATNLGTSSAGTTTVTVDAANSLATISGSDDTADAGIIYYKPAIVRTDVRKYRTKIKLLQPTTGWDTTFGGHGIIGFTALSGISLPAVMPDTSWNPYIILKIELDRINNKCVFIRRNSTNTTQWLNGSTWANAGDISLFPTLGTHDPNTEYFIPQIETSTTGAKMSLYAEDETLIATTGWIPWTDIQGTTVNTNTHLVIGDPYTNIMKHNFQLDYIKID